MQRIGRYEVISELGRGSMGAVFKARDPQIGRTVAIKIILTANLSPADLQIYQQRFQREAQAAGQMSHPGIITIHDIAEDETGQPFLVMEFIEGTGLDRLLAPGAERPPLERCLEIAHQVAEALDYAHRRGVVHRDIKPANILLTSEGRAKIADFGIAKLAGMQMTQTGQMVGTPAFMSPEQFSGGAVDARSDLFSFGGMFYWMLTGERPFAGDNLTTVSFKVVYTAVIPARQLNPALPPQVETILSRCLAKNPGDRYPSCRELADDLNALKEGRAVQTQPLVAAPIEQTVAGVVPPAAAPGPPAPADRTVAQTVAGVAPTATIPGGPVVATEYKEVPAVARVAEPSFFERRKRIIALVAPLFLALALAGYWFWPARQQPAQTQPEASQEPPPAATPVAAPTPPPEPAPEPKATPTKTAPRTQPRAQEPVAKKPSRQETLLEKGKEIVDKVLQKKKSSPKSKRRR